MITIHAPNAVIGWLVVVDLLLGAATAGRLFWRLVLIAAGRG